MAFALARGQRGRLEVTMRLLPKVDRRCGHRCLPTSVFARLVPSCRVAGGLHVVAIVALVVLCWLLWPITYSRRHCLPLVSR